MPAPAVVICAYNRLAAFEFGAALELFALPRPEFPAWYDVEVCGVEDGLYRTSAGAVDVVVKQGLRPLARADMIVIPGWRSVEENPPLAFINALRKAHARGARLVSFCSGAFALAAAGLLDGRRATTHWRYADVLARRFPQVHFESNVLYVEHDNIFTSAGSAAGLDLGLHLIRLDFGAKVANAVARRLVIPPHREGGQAQFVETPVPARPDGLSPALDWARARLDQQLTVEDIASKAGISRRSFDRKFRSALGVSPKQWLIAARVERAKTLLETTRLSIEQITAACGFSSSLSLRLHFQDRLGINPKRFRQQFQANLR